MKETFRGRYRPTSVEFEVLWNTATISMDANVLLATYEFSSRTRKELFAMFDSIQDRIWVPYRFAEEFQTRRLTVISRQVSSYQEARKTVNNLLDNHFKIKNRHPFVSKTSLISLEKICKELSKGEIEHQKLFSNDPHFTKISDLLDGKIGKRLSDEELLTAIEEGRKRFEAEFPPGYKDNKKPEPEKFGDYFGWRELLARGRENKTPLIFVTNETKSDWWHIHNGDTRIGPRHELVDEYFNASGQTLYIYSLLEFMRYAKNHLDQEISSATLQEVAELSFEVFDEPVLSEDKTTERKPSTTNSLLSFFKSEITDLKPETSQEPNPKDPSSATPDEKMEDNADKPGY
jgi:hypothetical protein